MSSRKEDFTSRWSRLKRENQAQPSIEVPPETGDEVAALSDTDAERIEKPDAELTDSELLEKYELPDPTQMKAGDDFSVFMKRAIPDRLRRRALRVLWGSNPILANLDELVDYGEDFTDAATVVENMQTIYQVGKGASWKFKEEQERLAAERAAEEAEAAERRAHNASPDTELALEEPDAEEADDGIDEVEDGESAGHEEIAVLEDTQPNVPPLAPKPRPMRFEFD